MSPEQPPSGKDPVLTEEWEALQDEAEQIYAFAEGQLGTLQSRSAKHIVRTLGISLARSWFEVMRPSPEYMQISRDSIDQLERYFDLLDEFPDFLEGESTQGSGHFPDLFDAGHSAGELIDVYEKRLREPDTPSSESGGDQS